MQRLRSRDAARLLQLYRHYRLARRVLTLREAAKRLGGVERVTEAAKALSESGYEVVVRPDLVIEVRRRGA